MALSIPIVVPLPVEGGGGRGAEDGPQNVLAVATLEEVEVVEGEALVDLLLEEFQT